MPGNQITLSEKLILKKEVQNKLVHILGDCSITVFRKIIDRLVANKHLASIDVLEKLRAVGHVKGFGHLNVIELLIQKKLYRDVIKLAKILRHKETPANQMIQLFLIHSVELPSEAQRSLCDILLVAPGMNSKLMASLLTKSIKKDSQRTPFLNFVARAGMTDYVLSLIKYANKYPLRNFDCKVADCIADAIKAALNSEKYNTAFVLCDLYRSLLPFNDSQKVDSPLLYLDSRIFQSQFSPILQSLARNNPQNCAHFLEKIFNLAHLFLDDQNYKLFYFQGFKKNTLTRSVMPVPYSFEGSLLEAYKNQDLAQLKQIQRKSQSQVEQKQKAAQGTSSSAISLLKETVDAVERDLKSQYYQELMNELAISKKLQTTYHECPLTTFRIVLSQVVSMASSTEDLLDIMNEDCYVLNYGRLNIVQMLMDNGNSRDIVLLANMIKDKGVSSSELCHLLAPAFFVCSKTYKSHLANVIFSAPNVNLITFNNFMLTSGGGQNILQCASRSNLITLVTACADAPEEFSSKAKCQQIVESASTVLKEAVAKDDFQIALQLFKIMLNNIDIKPNKSISSDRARRDINLVFPIGLQCFTTKTSADSIIFFQNYIKFARYIMPHDLYNRFYHQGTPSKFQRFSRTYTFSSDEMTSTYVGISPTIDKLFDPTLTPSRFMTKKRSNAGLNAQMTTLSIDSSSATLNKP